MQAAIEEIDKSTDNGKATPVCARFAVYGLHQGLVRLLIEKTLSNVI
jgi:hypothetical protein